MFGAPENRTVSWTSPQRVVDPLFLWSCLDPEAARIASSKITTTLGLVVHAAGETFTPPDADQSSVSAPPRGNAATTASRSHRRGCDRLPSVALPSLE